jgi:hypothetical protein
LLAEKWRAKVPDIKHTGARLKELEAEIAKIVGATRAGTFSGALQQALETAESEKSPLESNLKVGAAVAEKIAAFLPRAIDRYSELVESFETVARRDVERARAQLEQILGQDIRIYPTPERTLLEAEVCGSNAGLLQASGVGKISLVAGVGFEPTTFGL